MLIALSSHPSCSLLTLKPFFKPWRNLVPGLCEVHPVVGQWSRIPALPLNADVTILPYR